MNPVAPTTFQPNGSPIDHNEFVFQRATANAPFSLTLRWKSGESKFERLELVTPTKKELIAYAGAYFSDELDIDYRFSVRDDGLWLRVGNRRWERLDGTVRDEFVPNLSRAYDNRIFTFQRDKSKRVVGVNVSLFRVRGVKFKRRRAARR